jgi:hypothetical protein
MNRYYSLGLALILALTTAFGQRGRQQTGPNFPTDDPVIKSIWTEAMDNSHLQKLAHELLDVVGPRLVGTPQMANAHEWAIETFDEWDIPARKEQWGEWEGWERGITHIDLLEPRVRTLEGTMMAWSPGTPEDGVEAGTIILPDVKDSLAFQEWLPNVRGKFVLISQPQPTGRPTENWEEYGTPASRDSMKALQTRIRNEWRARIRKTGFRSDTLANVLEQAGAAGSIASRWSSGWGVNKIFGTKARKAVVVDLSLEDYNLLYRLTEYGDEPLVRIKADAKFLGAVPTFNTIAEIKGSEKPDEYIILSAHFDSWEAGSGATDNGTGSITMMEVARILKKHYPNPKRTILVGLWGSEEQGLNGSRAFVQDHPEIVEKTQAVFNQDNGTGRAVSISAQGLVDASASIARWISRTPGAVTQHVKLSFPGMPGGGGSDYASFVAAGAPGFSLSSLNWDYFLYTWHTNRDTYDKLVFDDLKNNVVLAASLAYMASEDPTFTPRTQRILPVNPRTGKVRTWPAMREPNRKGRLK